MSGLPGEDTPSFVPPAGDDANTLFRTLFMASPDALIVANADGIIVLANPAAATLLAYPIDTLTGMEVDALVPDSIRPRHAAYRHSYGRNPHARPMGTQMELVAKRGDGSEVMVEIALSPLQSHGLPFVMAAIRDIAAYPRMKQALRRARYSEHLAQLGRMAVDARGAEALLEQAPVIAAQALQVDVVRVFLVEPDGLSFRVAGAVGVVGNEAVGDRLPNRPNTSPGFVLEQARAITVEDYASERRFAVPSAYLAAGLSSGLSVPMSDRGRAIGVLTVRSQEARRFGDDEIRFLESFSNLLTTSLQRAQSEEALKHAQRLESVGQLTGGIAHDFNNLLTVIQGNLQVLEELEAVAEHPMGRQLVAAAARATRRGAELTGKLLAFSRRQVLQPSAVDVNLMLVSLSDMLRRTLDQRIRIEVDTRPGFPPVSADPGQLESALLNIAINARDAMPDGGTLRFQADLCSSLPAEVRDDLEVPVPLSSPFMAISIADTGSGMPEDVKARAFEPFFTTKEAGRGTGLGLSTVYGFVKQSRGAVQIESAPGAGTTLTLYLPCHQVDEVAASDDLADSRTLPAGLKVLLVEDDVEVRAVVCHFLDALGCKTEVTANAEQALLALAGAQPFDLLLSDIALGAGMRGTELALRAQSLDPDMAVLLMSGFSADLLQADRESPPSWELLRKPYSREELAQAMVRALGSS